MVVGSSRRLFNGGMKIVENDTTGSKTGGARQVGFEGQAGRSDLQLGAGARYSVQ